MTLHLEGSNIKDQAQKEISVPSTGNMPRASSPAPTGKAHPPASLPRVTLPKSGGAIRGIGEKFNVNAATGTSSLTVPLPASAGRSGFSPEISLSYDSGSGNGPFGYGWTVSLPAIVRKTDKGLPRYNDADESDTFILSGVEDLVPVTGDDGVIQRSRRSLHGAEYEITSYMPRVEGAFARIERWTSCVTDVSHWRTITRTNITSLFGFDAASQVVNPANPKHVFSYKICSSWDDKGNVFAYNYRRDDDAGVDLTLASEAQRTAANRRSQNYLKSVRYGNRTPWYPAWTEDGGQTPLPTDWMFELVFDYGDHQQEVPKPHADLAWPCRTDSFSTYRPGFEVRTQRLCRRILMFHRFAELGVEPCLVKSVDLSYQEGAATFVQSMTSRSYLRNPQDSSYSIVRSADGVALSPLSLPPLEFTYTQATIDDTIRFVDRDSLPGAPAGVDGARYQWVDMDGEGLPGVLSEQANNWYYKRNSSTLPVEIDADFVSVARFEHVDVVSERPSIAALSSGQQLMDLGGEGHQCLVEFGRSIAGYHDRDQAGGWVQFKAFAFWPNIVWNDPNLRHIDLDGDGHPDLLITEDEVFTWYPSLAKNGFGPASSVRKALDEDSGPAVVFADQTQSIYLADMSGDGLTDIARIRNGEICYWPNLGYGLFGAKITMDHAPLFETADQFDQKRIRLADIDGSGTTDIVYLGRGKLTFWFNLSGNSFGEANILSQFPDVDSVATVSVIDLLGSGTSCIVWSSPLPGDSDSPIRYIDLMSSGKPHLLTSVKNNLGAETRVHYAPSTRFYLQDRMVGRPWITRLGFPVQVVERSETFDYVSKAKYVTRYAYHHGYFDGVEREFRGFGMVEEWDTDSFSRYSGVGLFTQTPQTAGEEFHLAPAHTRTWYHTGALIGADCISRQYASEYYAADPQAWNLPDSTLPDGLTELELLEACRALRGHVLRREQYADDGSSQSGHPYAVTEHTYSVRLLQKQHSNKHASLYPFETESLNCHYERNPADPRIDHHLTLEVDDFGSVTRSAAVGYPRRTPQGGGSLSTPEQTQTLISYAESSFANRPNEADWQHLGLTVESKEYELTGVERKLNSFPFTRAAMLNATATAVEIPYEAQPDRGALQKRLLHRSLSLYRKDDLSGPLDIGAIESLALLWESYAIALTPGLLSGVYGAKLSSAELTAILGVEAGYRDLDSTGSWWIPSGRFHYSANADAPDAALARSSFYLPAGVRDPFGNVSRVAYDPYNLLPIRAEDAIGNTSVAQIDYRVLSPVMMTDPNSNRAAVQFDAHGMITATVVMGKEGENEGDTLDDPTTKLEYDLFQWMQVGRPNFVHVSAREQHGPSNLRWQESYSYSDGLGREVMKKTQAPAGPAPVRDMAGILQRDAAGNLFITTVTSRWIGNGRMVHDNKGNPVKKYEPYFSSTPAFEDETELVQSGVTPILRYDPLGRLVRTDMPDGTLSRVEFGPWMQLSFDANDTVLESRWYTDRISGTSGVASMPAEVRAAKLVERHANTPTAAHYDCLGRTFLTIADNGDAGKYETRVELDIEGQHKSVTDARGNRVVTQVFDMAGKTVHHTSMDAGESWQLNNVVGSPIRSWNSRGYVVRHTFDVLLRPLQIYVKSGSSAERVAQRMVYGESLPGSDAKNLRGRLYQHYDGAGLVTTIVHDFKGNLLQSSRQLLANYKDDVDWAASPAPVLEPAVYPAANTFDALNRHTSLTTPDLSVANPGFDEANRLISMAVKFKSSQTQTQFITGVIYNSKGQRERIDYGNGVSTLYDHDPLNFRLRGLKTVRSADGVVLQQLAYAFDPIGNIVELRDDAQATIYFNNQVVAPSGQYEYDPIYRLVSATGREHAGQGATGQPTFDDGFRVRLPHPNDASGMTRYTERYEYDSVSNIMRMLHNAGGNGWSLRYDYDKTSNRLNATSAAGDPDGVFSAAYQYDGAGNMVRMPHMPFMKWDYKSELLATSRQAVISGTPETTYYVYSASGERIRKVTDRQAPQGQAPARKEERIYLGGFEIYRSYQGDGASIDLERETLHVMDDKQRIAIVETRTQGSDPSPQQLTRYQHGNHLGSATIELDALAQIISYEEFYPYGSTSYQGVRSQMETPKRYRYTGKERDEESGLYYHGDRYYAPWIGRWMSCDPAGLKGPASLYCYVTGNPITLVDPSGRDGVDATGYMLQQAAQGWDAIMETIFGGHMHSTSPTHADYRPPEGGVGGIGGGVVRAVTLQAVPLERNPSEASRSGADVGAGLVPFFDPAGRLITGKTAGNHESSRVFAGVELGIQVLPFAIEAYGAVGPGEAAARTPMPGELDIKASVDAIVSPAVPPPEVPPLSPESPTPQPKSIAPPSGASSGPDRLFPDLTDSEVSSAIDKSTSGQAVKMPGKNPKTGEGLTDQVIKADATKPIAHHDNTKLRGIKGAPGGKVEVRRHSANPNAPAGTYSHDNPTTQINSVKPKMYMLPDGSYKPLDAMSDPEKASVHYK